LVASAGAINMDVNLFLERLPRAGEELPIKKITRVPGGKAANVAVAVARLLGPSRSALLGALGRDPIGEMQLKALREEGVDTGGIWMDGDSESGQAYILIDSAGQNIISTFFGANASLRPEMLEGRDVRRVLKDVRFLVVMDVPLDFARALFETGRDRGMSILWAPGVRTLQGRGMLMELLDRVDFLVLNEAEVLGLTGHDTAHEAYRSLVEWNEGLHLIATMGSRGALLLGPGLEERAAGVDLASVGMAPVNTVGCGDAFIGCFAAQVVMGRSLAEALFLANCAGAFKATKPETRGSPTQEELDGFVDLLRMPRKG
jgi:ribokinase